MPNRFERGSQYNDTYWEGESGNIEKSGVNPSDLIRPEAIPRQGLMFHPETGTGRKDDPLVSPARRIKSFTRGLGLSDRTSNVLNDEEKRDQGNREANAKYQYKRRYGKDIAKDLTEHDIAQDMLLANAVDSNLSIHDVDPPKPSRIEESAGVMNQRPTVIATMKHPTGNLGVFSYSGDSRNGGPRITVDVGKKGSADTLAHELGHDAHLTGIDGKVKVPLESIQGVRTNDHEYKGNKGSDPVAEGVADGYADYRSSDYPRIGDMDPKLKSRQERLRSSLGDAESGTYGTHSKIFANPTSRALYGVMRQHIATGGEMPSSDYKDETLRSLGRPVAVSRGIRLQRTDNAPNELSLGRMVHENPHLKDMYSWHPADKALHAAVNRAHRVYTGNLENEAHRSKVRAIRGLPANADVSMVTRVHDQLFDPDA